MAKDYCKGGGLDTPETRRFAVYQGDGCYANPVTGLTHSTSPSIAVTREAAVALCHAVRARGHSAWVVTHPAALGGAA